MSTSTRQPPPMRVVSKGGFWLKETTMPSPPPPPAPAVRDNLPNIIRNYADCEEMMGGYVQADCMREAADRLEEAERLVVAARAELARLGPIVVLARTVCGQNNCNCPGAPKMKKALEA